MYLKAVTLFATVALALPVADPVADAELLERQIGVSGNNGNACLQLGVLGGCVGVDGISGSLPGLQGSLGPNGISGNIGDGVIVGSLGPDGLKGALDVIPPKGPEVTGELGPNGLKADILGVGGSIGPNGIEGHLPGLVGKIGPNGIYGNIGDGFLEGSLGPDGLKGSLDVAPPKGPEVFGAIGPNGVQGDILGFGGSIGPNGLSVHVPGLEAGLGPNGVQIGPNSPSPVVKALQQSASATTRPVVVSQTANAAPAVRDPKSWAAAVAVGGLIAGLL